MTSAIRATEARRVRVRGVVQGVGFRPFVFRLAVALKLRGYVRNDGEGVDIQVEGEPAALAEFERRLCCEAPSAARITDVRVTVSVARGWEGFAVDASTSTECARAVVAPDLALCAACLSELVAPGSRRHRHVYASCSDCGPRWSIVTGVPYDRSRTSMANWAMCDACREEYIDPRDRRFHMQAIACAVCGPRYFLTQGTGDRVFDIAAIRGAASLLRDGNIVAIKGVGGYHLACDARNAAALQALRQRKYRKEKAFAVMVSELGVARTLVQLSRHDEELLSSPERPIVVASALASLPGVAPGQRTLGVMLPYTGLHHMLFAENAPAVLVVTSGNRSSEPIAVDDAEAVDRLSGLADAFLVGERPIVRRVEDSVVHATSSGAVVLRRSRGYAPGIVAHLPIDDAVLAVGGDLKNTVTLVVDGQAIVSQHLGDLDDLAARTAFEAAARDLLSMYGVAPHDLTVVHDLHPQYVSTMWAEALPARARIGVQHHRAHIASVLAERGEFERRVIGVACDGTGYGDDGSIWGGEFFAGSLSEGFRRVGHLREALLAGGDAAARFPPQAAAGFLAQLDDLPDLCGPPFGFPARYRSARALIERGMRTFRTTSVGRLFDTAAALLGFTRPVTYEGQAAMWLESLATAGRSERAPAAPWRDGELDFRPLLEELIGGRLGGRDTAGLARQFHDSLAAGIADAAAALCDEYGVNGVVLSGGVFQNARLTDMIGRRLAERAIPVWMNRIVPPNDGGVSLGQAAMSLAARRDAARTHVAHGMSV